MYRVCQSLLEAPPHQVVSRCPNPKAESLSSEYAFDQVLAYKVATYTNVCLAVFKFPATMSLRQHKQNIKCGMPPVKHDLCVVLGSIIRSLLKPAPKNSTRLTGKLWHARGTMTLLPLSAPPPVWSGFWHLSYANVTWNKARKPHWLI